MLVEEGGGLNDGGFAAVNNLTSNRHFGNAAIAYFDGHVVMYKASLYNSLSTANRSNLFLKPPGSLK